MRWWQVVIAYVYKSIYLMVLPKFCKNINYIQWFLNWKRMQWNESGALKNVMKVLLFSFLSTRELNFLCKLFRIDFYSVWCWCFWNASLKMFLYSSVNKICNKPKWNCIKCLIYFWKVFIFIKPIIISKFVWHINSICFE